MERHGYLRQKVAWKAALLFSIAISVFVLALFYYWFGVANRHVIFLYAHTTKGIPRAEPFDEITRSRYWMAGLVAMGAVLVWYTALNWALGRIAAWRRRAYDAPDGRRVWLLCALPLAAGIPAITLTVNAPTLPPDLAAACAAAALIGLACALWPGAWAARRPRDLAWLALDGAGVMLPLLLMRAIELPGRGVFVSVPRAIVFSAGSVAAGSGWLGVMTVLRLWRRTALPGVEAVFAAGVCEGYLLLPLAHYVLGAPAYRYISTASNFFAFDRVFQFFVVATAVAISTATVWLRTRVAAALGRKADREDVR